MARQSWYDWEDFFRRAGFGGEGPRAKPAAGEAEEARVRWFDSCRTLEEGKKHYRELMLEHHPDKGGDPELAKQVNLGWEAFQIWVLDHVFANQEERASRSGEAFSFTEDTKRKYAAILAEVLAMNVRVEIIGSWIYIWDCAGYIVPLTCLGFWWSKKQGCMIYNGEDGPTYAQRKQARYSKIRSKSDLYRVFDHEVLREQDRLEDK